jgi:hypothetical protein
MQFESPGILKKRVYSFIVYILITHNVVRVRVCERERESHHHTCRKNESIISLLQRMKMKTRDV